MSDGPVLRMAAFAAAPGGGNPAGVVLDASGWSDEQMQATAADVGYSETAFVTEPLTAGRRLVVRYFSPGAEVPFCGHATIATAVAVAQACGAGPLLFETPVGEIELETHLDAGRVLASFRSVDPHVSEFDPSILASLLDLLGLTREALSARLPPRLAFAGNTHPILVLPDRATFDTFTFDAAAVRALMDEQGWAGTVTVLWQATPTEFEARNLFPVGDIREDPATGSAAASTGAYLRAVGQVQPPATVLIRQGAHVGRPSLLTVDIPVAGGITVAGSAEPIPGT